MAAVEKSQDVQEKAPKIQDEEHGRTLALRIGNETNVLITLDHPVRTTLRDDVVEVDAVRLWVDDLDGFVSAVRTHIP
ncbi:MAG: hypothetical protein WBX17_06345 [Microbacterium sp.]